MPPAARLSDMHTCPLVMPGPVPHVGGPILPPCATTVIIGGMPAARVSDMAICPPAGPDPIVKGSISVFINYLPAARLGDTTAHGGVIVTGFPTVLIGDGQLSPKLLMAIASMGMDIAMALVKQISPLAAGAAMSAPLQQKKALVNAARGGVPFCEICAKQGSQPDPNPENNTAFGKRFKGMTGMELSNSIDAYKADTGKDLSPKTVETLFTDADKAKEILMKDKSLHTAYRDILNSNSPATEAEAKKQGFVKLGAHKSIFHNPWYNPFQNSKYVSKDGHREAVFDGRGVLVNSNDYKGTFNFFGPDKAAEHWKADVEPYQKWGN